jgi:two-component system, NarL family, response regulator LiaR
MSEQRNGRGFDSHHLGPADRDGHFGLRQIRILIADDHTLVRQGLRQLCEGPGGFTVVAEAENGSQAVTLARVTQPDVILMDIVMPDVDGVEAIRQIMRDNPAARIIALTMYRQEQYLLDAIRAGARGYLIKTVDTHDLIASIEAVHRGDYLIDPIIAARVLGELHTGMPPQAPRVEPLTEGEMAVLRLVAQGVHNQEIAQALGYSVYTVANRLRTIYEKLHVTNRTQAALYALRHGWAALDEPPG